MRVLKGAVRDKRMEKTNAGKEGVRAHATMTIGLAPAPLYAFWRDVEKAPLWQEGVQSVVSLGGNRSRWAMQGPFHTMLEWVSEITEEDPDHRIAWQTVSGDVSQQGEVTFVPAPAERGTIVSLTQTFLLPGGRLTNAASGMMARSPRQLVVENLRHFKQLMEAGEIPTTDDQPTGLRSVSGKVKEFAYGETNPTPSGGIRQVAGTGKSA